MTESSEQKAGLNIKAVSERTALPLHTLRAWERCYDALPCAKLETPGAAIYYPLNKSILQAT